MTIPLEEEQRVATIKAPWEKISIFSELPLRSQMRSKKNTFAIPCSILPSKPLPPLSLLRRKRLAMRNIRILAISQTFKPNQVHGARNRIRLHLRRPRRMHRTVASALPDLRPLCKQRSWHRHRPRQLHTSSIHPVWA